MLPAPPRLWRSGPGKSDTLARCAVFRDDPECYTTTLEHLRAVGAAELRNTARQWLSDGVYVLDVLSFG